MATLSLSAGRGAVSDLKAPGLKPERRQAQLGGRLAQKSRWLDRRRAMVAAKHGESPGAGDVRCARALLGSGDPDELPGGFHDKLDSDARDRPCPQCDGVPVDSVAKPCGGTSTRNEASTLKPAVANRKRARSICPVFQSTRGAFCSRDLMPTQGAGSGRSKFPRTPAYRQCAGARARRSHRLGSLRLSRRIRQPREKRLGRRRAGN